MIRGLDLAVFLQYGQSVIFGVFTTKTVFLKENRVYWNHQKKTAFPGLRYIYDICELYT